MNTTTHVHDVSEVFISTPYNLYAATPEKGECWVADVICEDRGGNRHTVTVFARTRQALRRFMDDGTPIVRTGELAIAPFTVNK